MAPEGHTLTSVESEYSSSLSESGGEPIKDKQGSDDSSHTRRNREKLQCLNIILRATFKKLAQARARGATPTSRIGEMWLIDTRCGYDIFSDKLL